MPRKGRPRIDPTDQTVPFTVALPSKQLDALRAEARQAGCTVQDLLRRRLARASATSLQTRRRDDDDER